MDAVTKIKQSRNALSDKCLALQRATADVEWTVPSLCTSRANSSHSDSYRSTTVLVLSLTSVLDQPSALSVVQASKPILGPAEMLSDSYAFGVTIKIESEEEGGEEGLGGLERVAKGRGIGWIRMRSM